MKKAFNNLRVSRRKPLKAIKLISLVVKCETNNFYKYTKLINTINYLFR